MGMGVINFDTVIPTSKSQSILSTEYVLFNIGAPFFYATELAYDPTTDSVYWAFPQQGENPVTWYLGFWLDDSSPYQAVILVGPANSGVLPGPAGIYDKWIKITDSVEVPAIKAGQLILS